MILRRLKCGHYIKLNNNFGLLKNMRNSCIRKLFTAKIYTEIQKDYLVLLVNSFVGDQTCNILLVNNKHFIIN